MDALIYFCVTLPGFLGFCLFWIFYFLAIVWVFQKNAEMGLLSLFIPLMPLVLLRRHGGREERFLVWASLVAFTFATIWLGSGLLMAFHGHRA